MTGGLNRSILAGRLVADPEVRYTQNETAVTHFRLAINRNGSENADFISCVAWGGLAKVCGEYLKKGRLVAVEGRLQIRSYKAKNGQNKSATEVIVDNMQMLDSKFYNAAAKTTAEQTPELVKI
ncbi:MAG: single-stranded DNA-binding protein [Candidatus Margulisbacteria bacterium]|nr:single-stranded DNA-binding protein [Candidatus Margulisiibacteriota bacterium]